MKHTIIIVAILLAGCEIKREKPFAVVSKRFVGYNIQTQCEFKYLDKKGGGYFFQDSCSKYNVGDTLK